MRIGRETDRHGEIKHLCASVRCTVGARVKVVDIDVLARKVLCDFVDNTGIVECDNINGVRETGCAVSRRGVFDGGGEFQALR